MTNQKDLQSSFRAQRASAEFKAQVEADLKKYDKDGDGTFSKEEVVGIIEDFEKEKFEKQLSKKTNRHGCQV